MAKCSWLARSISAATRGLDRDTGTLVTALPLAEGSPGGAVPDHSAGCCPGSWADRERSAALVPLSLAQRRSMSRIVPILGCSISDSKIAPRLLQTHPVISSRKYQRIGHDQCRFVDSAQFLRHSKANHSRHCSAVQAAFSSMTGLALGRLWRFSTVNRGGSGIAWAVSQYGGGSLPACFMR